MHNFANPLNYKANMKISLGRTAVIIMALLGVSCSGYNKLLKSSDSEAKYKRAIEYFHAGKYSKTIQLMAEVVYVFDNTPRSDSIIYYVAASFYHQKDYLSSEEFFDQFRSEYGNSPFIEDVEYMYVKGFYYMSPEAERDQGSTRKAMFAIDEYLQRYPNSPKKEDLRQNIAELQQKLYDKARLNAKVYYNIGYYSSAVIALRNAIDDYPDSNHNEELSFLIVDSWHEYAKNSVESKQRERYLSLQEAYYNFVGDYPDSKYRKDADKWQANATKFLEKYANKHKEAGKTDGAASALPAGVPLTLPTGGPLSQPAAPLGQ